MDIKEIILEKSKLENELSNFFQEKLNNFRDKIGIYPSFIIYVETIDVSSVSDIHDRHIYSVKLKLSL